MSDYNFADALKLLFPVKNLGGVHDTDMELEAKALDRLQARAGQLLQEMSPATAYETLEDWEREYGCVPGLEDPLQLRQARVLQKMRELGRLDLPYFQAMAEGMGFSVVIEELKPFMCGWGEIGDELMVDDADWCWRVHITEEPGIFFRIGESTIGEYLSYGYQPLLEKIFDDLKPADTFVEFILSE